MDGWWRPKSNGNRIRFRAMMESGQLVDEEADIVQTQVIAHKARASIRNRDAIPLYLHTEEGHPPRWEENLLVETGLSAPPDTDSRYILEDSRNLFKGFKTGAVDPNPDSVMKQYSVAIAANVVALVVFCVCGLLAASMASEPVAAATNSTETMKTTEDGRVSYGVVDSLAGPLGAEASGTGEEAGSGDPEGRRGAGSDGTEDPVERRAVPDAGDGPPSRLP